MGQIIGIDASIAIYFLQRTSQFFIPAKKLFSLVEEGKLHGVFSVIGMIEVLTGPKKMNQPALAAQYKTALSQFPHLIIAPVSEAVVESASQLRAKYGIKTPDAIHIATAICHNAAAFISEDKQLLQVTEIPVRTLAKYI